MTTSVTITAPEDITVRVYSGNATDIAVDGYCLEDETLEEFSGCMRTFHIHGNKILTISELDLYEPSIK